MLRAFGQGWLEPLTHRLAKRIRYRGLAAAGTAVAVVALMGGIGLHYVNAVARTVAELEGKALALDSMAQARMTSTFTEAMLVIGLVAGVFALSALFAALRFADRLTQPIE